MSAIELLYQAAIEHPASRILIINAHAHTLLSPLSNVCELELHQSFKPEHDSLQSLGLKTSASLSENEHQLYGLVLLLPSKNKQQTYGWMATAMQRLIDGGKLIMACANVHGAKSYESAMQHLAGNIRSRSKSKCRIFSATKTGSLDSALQKKWRDTALPKVIASHGLITQPGLFSWDHADIGSQLLLDHLPESLSGNGMDLCCGYGLLCEQLLRTSTTINTLHLLESDALALECATRNTAVWQHKTQAHWLDATCDDLPEELDWIVCNPPFHSGQTRDIELGKIIIQRACESLKRGGVVYVVANRKLPYEALMRCKLTQCQSIIEANGFKIIKGVR